MRHIRILKSPVQVATVTYRGPNNTNNRCSKHEAPSAWDAFHERYSHVFPVRTPCKLAKISAAEWQAQIRKLPVIAGKGTDGWRAGELQRLPLAMRVIIADFFNAIEQGLHWPEGLCYAQIALQPKGDKSVPGKQCPISIFGILYRCWSSMRFRHMEAWREQWMPSNMRGARSGGSTHDISFMLSMEVEMAQLRGEAIAGFLFNWENALTGSPLTSLMVLLRLSVHLRGYAWP